MSGPLPLRERKQVLRSLLSFGGPLRFTAHRSRTGRAYWEHALASGWEGLVVKRADSLYVGGRSRDWLKFKAENNQEFVIGGYTDPQGSRAGFGALLIGYYDGNGQLAYAGKVGTGFTDATLAALTGHWRASAGRTRRSRPEPCRAPACTGSSRAWSARSGSPSGRPPGSFAIPGTWVCAGTRIPLRSPASARFSVRLLPADHGR